MSEPRHEITSDGVTVWVNGEHGLIGRFGRGGIDVHRSATDQVTMGTECLHCTHARPTSADWDIFVAKMREHHGIEIGPEHKPGRLKHA